MNDKTQKERLEQELRFLKESFEAEVISKEEFEKGKERIEKKLKEVVEEKEEAKNEKTEAKSEEKIKLRVIQDVKEHEHFENQTVEKKEVLQESAVETQKTEIKEEKRKNKFFKYAVLFIVLVFVVFFLYSLLKVNAPKLQEKTPQIELKEAPKINVIILNDRKNCFNCETQRVLGILEKWFGELNAKEIDYTTDEGKYLTEKFNVSALPVYILDENMTNKSGFEQLRRVFARKKNNYILSDNVAAPTFYFKRNNIPNKLDLFVVSNDSTSIKAEKNLIEFLANFKEVEFNKYSYDEQLTKELGIKNFPAFLISNRIKLSGVHTAETIKENFCKLNKLPACEKSLSKSLI